VYDKTIHYPWFGAYSVCGTNRVFPHSKRRNKLEDTKGACSEFKKTVPFRRSGDENSARGEKVIPKFKLQPGFPMVQANKFGGKKFCLKTMKQGLRVMTMENVEKPSLGRSCPSTSPKKCVYKTLEICVEGTQCPFDKIWLSNSRDSNSVPFAGKNLNFKYTGT
jgi:hypothetical protein